MLKEVIKTVITNESLEKHTEKKQNISCTTMVKKKQCYLIIRLCQPMYKTIIAYDYR